MSSPETTPPLVSRIPKDVALDRIAQRANVAQFVSFAPGAQEPNQQFCRILGFAANQRFADTREAMAALMSRSAEGLVNIRSFTPDSPQSRTFLYGLGSLEEAVDALRSLSAQGLFTIVNETVDVHDGGVSGVALGDLVEFTPDDTPRGVEKSGLASLPKAWADTVLKAVYGFAPDLDQLLPGRVEFSIHPRPRGWRHGHTLIWEHDFEDLSRPTGQAIWPNNYSRMLGDKVYGLLVAHAAGLAVPRTTVINRRVAPFSFGQETGSAETWLRTSPSEQTPGKYTTLKGWTDPFALLAGEDPHGRAIPSIISQAAVQAAFAGAAIELADGRIVIEGKHGDGSTFMAGNYPPENLPMLVVDAVRIVLDQARRALGSVRFEWVFDGQRTWIVQLHRGAAVSTQHEIVPGEAKNWIVFESSRGLEALRTLLTHLQPDTGINISGSIGLTSHVSDVLRKAAVPSRIL